DFKYEQDFAADQGLKDAYFEGQLFRFSRWRLGRFKESFSLGRQTSSSNAGFLETSLPVSALTPGRGLGAMIKSNERARYSWALSMTTSAISNNNEDDPTKASLAITGRVTGTPLYGNGGKQLLHIGASYSARKPNDDTVEYATRPEARFAPVIAATPEIAADRVTLTGVELAAVSGSYWAAAEWVGSSVEAENLSNPAFDGAYLQGGWFLSGESRFYKTSSGTFGRTRPNKLYTGGNPFNIVANGGGLELTARYSALDLSGGTINAGNVRNIGFGLNWYPN
ncbi:MAG: porin, partial [Gammaproteobacteria bacterium]|nr:porin [Gammaproteobacteria bacterium]